ncbi:uncharacterized protein LOC118780820 [Megalops cyprinoides]|uniref:uncharacterized protein LOC118780820 n=1 Tax=Megalops cyprinoides TaxID=118141 RepID=UPI0018654B66|nr:uncharacterized protein LOC118780820 [Megalops cyprinoides]
MDTQAGILLRVQLITTLYFTGASVYGSSVSVYSSVGGHTTLSCANVFYPNCSSTTWTHSSDRSETTELVELGKISDTEKAGRLRVESDCSLHMNNLNTEDAGLYTCLQFLYKGAPQHGGDAMVYLALLSISPSPPVIELRPGSTVTLDCLLYTYYGHGNCSRYAYNRVSLSWVNETGTELQVDPRYQVKHTSSCHSTLTVTLQRTDNNRKWRCQLTEEGEVKISDSYTTEWSDFGSGRMPSPTPTGSTRTRGQGSVAILVSGVSVCVAVCVVVAVIVTYKRRRAGKGHAENHNMTNQHTEQNTDTVTYAVVTHSTARPREKDRDTAEHCTYATIKTAN